MQRYFFNSLKFSKPQWFSFFGYLLIYIFGLVTGIIFIGWLFLFSCDTILCKLTQYEKKFNTKFEIFRGELWLLTGNKFKVRISDYAGRSFLYRKLNVTCLSTFIRIADLLSQKSVFQSSGQTEISLLDTRSPREDMYWYFGFNLPVAFQIISVKLKKLLSRKII